LGRAKGAGNTSWLLIPYCMPLVPRLPSRAFRDPSRRQSGVSKRAHRKYQARTGAKVKNTYSPATCPAASARRAGPNQTSEFTMTVRPSGLRAAITLALAAGAMGTAAPAVAQAQAGDATTLDRIEVTGSRIRSADVETSQPVYTISR